MRRLVLAGVLVVGACAFPPVANAAVLPGINGPLIFTSGRDDGATTLSDGRAQIWFLNGPGGGARRITTLSLSHHRHASWSPDRTKLAYARGPDDGTPFDGPWDIYVQDLKAGTPPQNITSTLGTNEDRPNWSPDGTHLTYAKQVTAGGTWDVVSKAADGMGTETKIADTTSAGSAASGQFSRPQWSQDGRFIYYGKIINAMVSPPDYDIYRAAADGSDHILGGTPIVSSPASEYQPALSPDGDRLCYTREVSGTGKDVYLVGSGGGTVSPLLVADGVQEYECAWSPDGEKIAFVRGAFGAGEILMRNSDATGPLDPVTDVAGRFDGNPEWTRNPRPRCSDKTAQVARNGFERVSLDCTDAQDPPSYQNDDLELEIARRPAHGTLGGINRNDGSVIYTPDANFVGRDTFTYTANDGTSKSEPATVTLGVGGVDVTPSKITRVRVFPRTWKRGRRLPRASARTGTRISWRLSEAARVRLVFQRKRGTRFRRAGMLRVPRAHQGLNRVRFQGRLSRRKKLKLGTYRIVVGATDAAGNRSTPRRSKTFKIVRR